VELYFKKGVDKMYLVIVDAAFAVLILLLFIVAGWLARADWFARSVVYWSVDWFLISN
jgi:hypothetical protein